jgi:hypothetical protein
MKGRHPKTFTQPEVGQRYSVGAGKQGGNSPNPLPAVTSKT